MSPDQPTNTPETGPSPARKLDVPKGLWRKCPDCEQMLFSRTVTENMEICPECDYHFRLGAADRVRQPVASPHQVACGE